jgi:anti-sigma B factor antagonist
MRMRRKSEIMLNINKKLDGEKLAVVLEGRLDTTTSPNLESELRASLDGIKELVFDFKDLAYISSAGLRVLLSAQKIMNKQGSMKICNVNSDIMEIFDVTGFTDILNIE